VREHVERMQKKIAYWNKQNNDVPTCQEQNSGGRRYKVIDRNHTLFRSNVQCQRGMYLAIIKRRL